MNSTGQNLTNKVVVVKQYKFTGTTENEISRMFQCVSGYGVSPEKHHQNETEDTKINGFFLANPAMPKTEWVVIDGNQDIERLATDREVFVATH